ncbi:hypothetical protein DITRI_Ditri12bG0131100 [Diplodiscus trichospermus]
MQPAFRILVLCGFGSRSLKDASNDEVSAIDQNSTPHAVMNSLLVKITDQEELACALYNNWWPMLSALMYVLVPMPCLFFGGGSTQFLTSRDGGGWIDAAKFLTGASAVGSFAIPIILRHAHMISTGAMFIEFTSFIIFVCTVLCFHRASLEDEW